MKSVKRAKAAGKPSSSAFVQHLPRWLAQEWTWGIILIAAILLAYQPVWYAGFIWDDDNHLTANPCIVGPLGFKEIWTTRLADICPFTRSTFWLEHAVWGLAPLPYHVVNVLLHGACAVVLWRVLRSVQVPGAWFGAAIWALHPVEVESVAWVTEMKNTESGLFFLLSILFFVRWLRIENLAGQTGANWNYAFTVLFAALAMASKSSTVILPGVLCLCAWWIEGRWQWRNLIRVAPLVLLAIAACALSIWTQGFYLAVEADPTPARTWPERLATAGDAVWFYLGKLAWPYPLMTMYPRWEINAGQWISYLPLLAVIIVLFILWIGRGTWSRPYFFVFAYFLVALLPALGLVDNPIFQFSLVFDHFQYLASMGPLALVGVGLARFTELFLASRIWAQSGLCAGIVLILGFVSWQRTWAYESNVTLWTDTLAKDPGCWMGYTMLGNALLQKAQPEQAMAAFRKGFEVKPHNALAHNNLGIVLVEQGRLDEAIEQYNKALEIRPNYAEAHNNLGRALAKRGRIDEAIAQYQKAMEIKPDYAPAYNDLGYAFAHEGRMGEAITQFQMALRFDPGYAEARNNLAKVEALVQQGVGQK